MGLDSSRYAVYKHTRLPREKKTIRIKGKDADANKWFRCWHCGFINNIECNEINTSEYARSGVVVILNNDGVYVPTITGGCSFCGSKNYA